MPNDEMIDQPTGQLSAILHSPEEVHGALRDLAAAGFSDGAVRVLCGERGVRRIDASGQYHGLSGRLTRITEALFADDDESVEADEALRAGEFVVAVAAATPEEVERARAAFGANGAHQLVRFGRWTTTFLEA